MTTIRMKATNIKTFKGKFFKILMETEHSQVGVMTVEPGGDSGPEETHDGDQLVYVVDGEADVTVDGERATMRRGDITIIRSGAQHHIKNNGSEALFFLTVYAPPQY